MRQRIREHNHAIKGQIDGCPVHQWKSIYLQGKGVLECEYCGCWVLTGSLGKSYPGMAIV